MAQAEGQTAGDFLQGINLLMAENQRQTQAQFAQQQAQMQAQISQLMASMEKMLTGMQAEKPGGGGDRRPRVLLEEKYYRNVPRFDGVGLDFTFWKNKLADALNVVDPKLTEAIGTITTAAGSIKNLATLDGTLSAEIRERFGPELYTVLSNLTDKEAGIILQNCQSKGLGRCGFTALCALAHRFDPKTPARVLQYLSSVINPPKVKDIRQLEQAIEEWEVRKGRLRSEFKEELSETVQVAILTGMLSSDLQDFVFQMGQTGDAIRYTAVRDKLMALASQRSQRMTPSPMDIGCVEDDSEMNCPQDTPEFIEVDAVERENLVCHRCGGKGHYASECASKQAKGGSKGKGGAKGSGGKSGSKGAANTGKSGGKGFQGKCFRCGVLGHSARECRAPAPMDIGEVGVGDTAAQPATVASVGGCWTISSVTQAKAPNIDNIAESGWQLAGSRWRGGPPPVGTSPTKGRQGAQCGTNRFAPLSICHVEQEEDVCGVSAEITVDSAAEESVCPATWAEQFGLDPVPKDRQIGLVNASGGKIQHYGSRRVVMTAAETGQRLEMNFQVTDVKKPLLAVCRLCERGNIVQFGPEPCHNFVQSVTTGDKLMLQRRGNSWVLPGELAAGAGF